MIQEFSSLHGHSHFSIFDGLSTPDENVRAAKEKGLKSVALTDHGTCHGHADLFLSGKKHGVKVVFGVEAYVIHSLPEWNELRAKIAKEKAEKGKKLDDGTDLSEVAADNQTSKVLRKKGHLVLLSRNRTGLANLYQLVYKAHRDGFYGKPRMDKEMLRQHAEGLIASSACMGGVISKVCWDMKDGKLAWADVVREAQEFDSIFGRGHFFLEIQLNEHEGQRFINECMVRISRETGIPLTVTTDFHYSKQEEWEARELLHMLDWDKTVLDFPDKKVDAEIKQLYVKSPEEMWLTYERFGKDRIDPVTMIEAFKNTLLIDSLIEDYEPDTHQRLPTLPYENPFKEVGQRAIEGLKRLGLADDLAYKQRLLFELGVIKEFGTSNYFLTMQQIVEEARKQMLVGPGRGSAAASLVCYCLGITDFDPVAGDLMFERFMNPARKELPDIDVDFQDVDATKDMLRRMFGSDNVACLSTYSTHQIKGLLKDLGRVFALDHNDVNTINRQIEKELRVLYVNQDKSTIVIKLEDIERVSPTYRKFIEENPELGRHVKTLYGRVSHVGRHASGVIIGDNLPAETAIFTSKGVVQTSFTEGIVNKNLSTMGFVKFDILSIACLKVIDYSLRLISQRHNIPYQDLKERIRQRNLDLNDPKVLKHVFWEGNFAGIFQFTEKGIRRLAQRVKPDTFTDLSAITSIYRPGPLGGGFDKLYVENKFNPEAIKYDHSLLVGILEKTRGCIVFQEQLMQICNQLGKMSWGDVNRVRKVLLKKDKSKSEEFLKKENDELSGKFFKGCEENGLEQEKAKELWEKLIKFGGYGFNKAHSDCYSLLSFQTAWLATYYPLEFYSALLTRGQAGELQDYVSDINRAGVKVLPVDVNLSKFEHAIEGSSIRLSFSSVLGLGPSAIEKIVAHQPYSDFLDFLQRSGVGKTAIQPLIQVGAFGSLHENMKELELRYSIYADEPKYKRKTPGRTGGVCWDDYVELFRSPVTPTGDPTNPLMVVQDYQSHEKVFLENSLLGFSVRGSPFEILDRDKKLDQLFGDRLLTYREFMECEEPVAMLPVVVKEFKERPQRNGQMFSFLKFGTAAGEEFEAPCFANIWANVKRRIKRGSVYVVTFNKDDSDAVKVGKPGWKHSPYACQEYVIDVDELTL